MICARLLVRESFQTSLFRLKKLYRKNIFNIKGNILRAHYYNLEKKIILANREYDQNCIFLYTRT